MSDPKPGLSRIKYNPKQTAKQSIHVRLSLDTTTRLQRYRDRLGSIHGGIPSVSFTVEELVTDYLRMKGF